MNYIDHRIYDIESQLKIAQSLGYETVTDATIDLYMYRVSLNEIANTFKTCKRAQYDRLKKIGLKVVRNRLQNGSITPIIRDYYNQINIANSIGYNDPFQAAKALYDQNNSLSEIGEIFGTSKSCQRQRLKKIGVKMRSRGGKNNKLTDTKKGRLK